MKIIISTLALFYCSITLASAHQGNLSVTIVNNSHDNYLFLDADSEKNNLKNIVDYPKPAIALSTTKNAFLAEISTTEYSLGLAPEGNFRYENQHDGSICSFRFDSRGVTLLSNNNHCSVINEKPWTSLGIPYQWNAIVTISDSSYM